MRVLLAGYNVDAEVLQQAIATGVEEDRLTPEVLSAAYARISRSPLPVDALRREARQEVAKARASNERIVFGLGHASVAEHAVFNFDLMGISRLAIEAVERSRLCSYTEKSQRYIRLEDEIVHPAEIEQLGLGARFTELVQLQYRAYHQLYERLLADLSARYPERLEKKAQRRELEGWAKEDARYVTSLAVEGQLGLTANARNLELMIRRLAGHPLHEVQTLAQTLKEQAQAVAPSLIRYTAPGAADRETNDALAQLCHELAFEHAGSTSEVVAEGSLETPNQSRTDSARAASSFASVRLIRVTPAGDLTALAALLHGVSGQSYHVCREHLRLMDEKNRRRIFATVFDALQVHDALPRAFEMVQLLFELTISASCFAQLKRHRMATLTTQPYDPRLGTTMPEAVERAGLAPLFQRVMAASEQLYQEVAPNHPAAAAYVLTQAHRRRVLFQLNARELYHFCRLRQDQHAQWDIRQVADRMHALAQRELPLTLALACGKDQFEKQQHALRVS